MNITITNKTSNILYAQVYFFVFLCPFSAGQWAGKELNLARYVKEDRLLSFQIVFRSTHGICCGPLRTDTQLSNHARLETVEGHGMKVVPRQKTIIYNNL